MKHITTVVLRLGGVLTIFTGLTIATQTIIQIIAATSAMSGFPEGLPPGMSIDVKGAAGRIGSWAIAGHVSIAVWGAVLVALARAISESITKE